MRRTRQNWNSVWQESLWQPHNPHDQPAPPGWCRIDPGLGAAAIRVPAASREDSRPQAILKFQPRNSFDYRVRYEPQLLLVNYLLLANSFVSENLICTISQYTDSNQSGVSELFLLHKKFTNTRFNCKIFILGFTRFGFVRSLFSTSSTATGKISPIFQGI